MKRLVALGTILFLTSCGPGQPLGPTITPTPEPTATPLPPTAVPTFVPVDWGDIVYNPSDFDISDYNDIDPSGSLIQGIHVVLKDPISPLSIGRLDIHIYSTPEDAAAQFEKWVDSDVNSLDSHAISKSKLGNPYASGHTIKGASGDTPKMIAVAYVIQACRGVLNYSAVIVGTDTDFTKAVEKTEEELTKVTCP